MRSLVIDYSLYSSGRVLVLNWWEFPPLWRSTKLDEGRKEEAKKGAEEEEEEEEVCSVPGEEEVLSSRPEDLNMEVSPRQLESSVSTITPVPVPVLLPSASQSYQLREVREASK